MPLVLKLTPEQLQMCEDCAKAIGRPVVISPRFCEPPPPDPEQAERIRRVLEEAFLAPYQEGR